MNTSKIYFGTELVHTLERRDSLALILVQGGADNTTIFDLNLRFIRVTLECKGVLHPFVVITL